MRLLLYKILTQTIILLGWVRKRLIKKSWRERPADRIFDFYNFDCMECCDCGLSHETEYFGPDVKCGHSSAYSGLKIVGHMFPLRPKGYNYGLRWGAAIPDLAKEIPNL